MNKPASIVARVLSANLLFWLAACSAPSTANEDQTPPPPTTNELGHVHLAVSTSVPAAQEFFDQGLAWCYGFHHQEAMRCFRAAVEADPNLAMAHWGLCYAAGPHINNMAMTDEANAAAVAEAKLATELAGNATAVERALIAAIASRYAIPASEADPTTEARAEVARAEVDRAALDRAYAEAMRSVYEAHGDVDDVAALYAESLMNLRPWDLWQPDGTPQPGTSEVLRVLEDLLAAHPEHPQANHLYIHATEASPHPELAVPCAERLVDRAPAIGHLTHMPSHVFIRVGRYEEAAKANRLGIAADRAIIARTGRVGFYEIYRAHNFHFLCYAAMFAGRADEAIAAARDLVQELPADAVRSMPEYLESYLAVPYHALVRFGRWHEMLAEPAPPAWQHSVRATWHYGRGIAYAATGKVVDAQREQQAFAIEYAAVPEHWLAGNNPTRAVLAIGEAFLAGEVGFRAGDRDQAFADLRLAVARSDALRYDEPWGWMMPPRHALGALLLEAGETAAAADAYREDLVQHPHNGWALHGLAECQRRLGDNALAAETIQRFEAAWQHATVSIGASCFCRRP